MKPLMRRQNWLRGTVLACGLEALGVAVYLLSIPGDPKNSFLWGLSLQRLGMALVLLALAAALIFLPVWGLRFYPALWAKFERVSANPRPARVILFIAGSILAAGWVVTFSPGYVFGGAGAYFDRLRPLLAWVTLTALQTMCFMLLLVFPPTAWSSTQQASTAGGSNPGLTRDSAIQPSGHSAVLSSKSPLFAWGFSFGVLLLAWGGIALSGLGLNPDPLSWNQPGIPLLGIQILIAWGIGLGLIFAERVESRRCSPVCSRKLDIALFLLIWITAALAWNLVPFPGSFFAPGPYPPNQAYYPFSDAARYDIDAQYALLGMKFNGGDFTDKPLYSLLLLFLHAAAGQRYDVLVALQVGVLAIFPALLFLLGRRFHSRAAGAVAAVVAIFKEANAIALSQSLLSSNTRVLLSEVLTAVMLLLFTWFMVEWLRQPRRRTLYPLLAGGCLGLATLVRHNPWLLLPAAVLIALPAYLIRRREDGDFQPVQAGRRPGFGRRHLPALKKWAIACLGLGVALVMAVAPWMARSQATNQTPFYFLIPLQGSIFSNRYGTVRSTPLPGSAAAAVTPSAVPARPDSTPTPAATAAPGASHPAKAPITARFIHSIQQNLRRLPAILSFTSTHFVHNLVASVVVLPLSPVLDDLNHTLNPADGLTGAPQTSFWSPNWSGAISLPQGLLLGACLASIALGIALAWRRLGVAGLVPVVTLLGYHLANALARTSGGRYLVPVDWVVSFYFVLGLVQASAWLVHLWQPPLAPIPQPPPSSPSVFLSGRWNAVRAHLPAVGVCLAFLAIGALLPLSELAIPRMYQPNPPRVLANSPWVPPGLLASVGISDAEFDAFGNTPGAHILVGRALYPRFYTFNQGEDDRFSEFAVRAYPRLAFDILGMRGFHAVVLPLPASPTDFPQWAEVIVLGCAGKTGLEAAAVIERQPVLKIYLRQPWQGGQLACPLPEVVCDDNRVCK